MRAFHVAFVVGLIAIPGFLQAATPSNAQNMMPGFQLGAGKEYTDDEKARMKANEDAAKAARATVPNAKASSDPWAGARAAETPPPKAVKPKATQ